MENIQIMPISYDTPKISVILPIYNQEKFLPKALNSLSDQTLADAEFICVNDGSTDNSLQIMEEYAKKDRRFKILDQKNQGAGRARNNGVKIANGEYIAFLDPDDWFENKALSSLYKEAKEKNCDMLVFDYKVVNKDGKFLQKNSIAEHVKRVFSLNDGAVFNWENIKGKLFNGLYFATWNKIYRRDFINKYHLHCGTSKIAEDAPFTLGATLRAQRIGYSAKPLYNYRIHDNSAIRTVSDKNLCVFQSFDSIKRVMRECGLTEELSQEFDTYVVNRCNVGIKRVASKDTFEKVRLQRLTPKQNQIVNNLRETGSALMGMLEGLKLKKL